MVRSVAELTRVAETTTPIYPSVPLARYLNTASKARDEGYTCYEQGDFESAYVYLLRFVTLVVKDLSRHPDWREPKLSNQRHQRKLFKDQALSAIAVAEDCKREIRAVEQTEVSVRRVEQQRSEEAARQAELAEQASEARRQAQAAQKAQHEVDRLAARAQAAQAGQARPRAVPPPGDILSILESSLGDGSRPRRAYPSLQPPPARPPPRAAGVPGIPQQPAPPPPSPGPRSTLAYGSFLPPRRDLPPAPAPGQGVLIPTDDDDGAALQPPPKQSSAAEELMALLSSETLMHSTQPHVQSRPPQAPGEGVGAPAECSPEAGERRDELGVTGDARTDRGGGESQADMDMDEAPDAADGLAPSAPATADVGRGGERHSDGGAEVTAQPETNRDSATAEVGLPPAHPPSSTSTSSGEAGGARHKPQGVAYAQRQVPSGPVIGGQGREPTRDVHAVGAPPPPKLSARPAPTTQNQRERLRHHLALRGFVEQPVPGDGNCQFHALVDQLEQNGVGGVDHKSLRAKAVQWLKANAKRAMDDGSAGGVTTLRDSIGVEDWSKYLSDMRRDGVTWGDEGTLLAVSALYRAEIVVISSLSEEYCHIVHPPPTWKIPLRMRLYLGHYHEFHYVSVRFA